MKISKKGRYALRSMVYLAVNESEEKMTLGDIAMVNGISIKYLEQIFSSLRRAGLVKSIHGINGGYFLGRHPSEITVEDVLDAVEGDYRIEDEVTTEDCMLKGISNAVQRLVIDEINFQTGKVISSVTMQDLANDYSRTDRDADEMYYI
ncbi:MAG: Rrf2 family transcriptional regulator [Clostridiaceae bacterium]|nr:Rrf2 family transcriptional regulator [Clostridiaceae bacterium]